MNSNAPHDEEDTSSEPQQLLPDATVTIHFDGLIYTAYNRKKKLYQAAVHTQAEGHQLIVKVRDSETGEIFPTDEQPWDSSHVTIKKRAPFWLFVDSGDGLQPKDFSAELHLPPEDKNDVRSFDRILNFQGLYNNRKLTLNTGRFAEFNFPHGTCYSALNTDATLSKISQNGQRPTVVGDINVSTLGAIDINSVSNGQVKKEIVLANKDGDFFRFPLENGKHYLIEITNGPIPEEDVEDHGDHSHPLPEDHFLQFYELFPLNPRDPKFLVEPAESGGAGGSPGFPPCIQGSGDREGGLP